MVDILPTLTMPLKSTSSYALVNRQNLDNFEAFIKIVYLSLQVPFKRINKMKFAILQSNKSMKKLQISIVENTENYCEFN